MSVAYGALSFPFFLPAGTWCESDVLVSNCCYNNGHKRRGLQQYELTIFHGSEDWHGCHQTIIKELVELCSLLKALGENRSPCFSSSQRPPTFFASWSPFLHIQGQEWCNSLPVLPQSHLPLTLLWPPSSTWNDPYNHIGPTQIIQGNNLPVLKSAIWIPSITLIPLCQYSQPLGIRM